MSSDELAISQSQHGVTSKHAVSFLRKKELDLPFPFSFLPPSHHTYSNQFLTMHFALSLLTLASISIATPSRLLGDENAGSQRFALNKRTTEYKSKLLYKTRSLGLELNCSSSLTTDVDGTFNYDFLTREALHVKKKYAQHVETARKRLEERKSGSLDKRGSARVALTDYIQGG